MKGIQIATNDDHINANDDRAFNMGAVISGDVVLDIGSKFAYTLNSVNSITIGDGDGVMQGLHFRIPEGTTQNLAIDNGESGKNRIDSIVVRYTKDQNTSLESVSLVLVKGTSTSGTPAAPAINTGSIRGGDLVADMRLYNIRLTGLSVESVTPVFEMYSASAIGAVVRKSGIAYRLLTLSASTGITFADNANRIYLRRSGNFVEAIFGIHCQLSAANTVYTLNGTIPAGYRPISDQRIFAGTESSNKLVGSGTAYDVTATGNIKIHSPSIAMYQRRCTAVWITQDAWPV